MRFSKIYLIISILLIISLALGLITYIFFARSWVIQIYEGQADAWLLELVNQVYPRFLVEKQRLPAHFFLQKADQVIFRATLCTLGLSAFLYFYAKKNTFRSSLHRFWDQKMETKYATRVTQVFFTLLLFIVTDWLFILLNLKSIASFYQPIFLLKLLALPFPATWVIYLLYGCLLVGILFCIFQVYPFFCSLIVGLLFILLQGYMYSFHKLDHTFATFTYVLLSLPCLIWENQRAKNNQANYQEVWPLRLAQLMVALAYLMAGIEKILIGGWEWFAPSTLISYLAMHTTYLGNWLMQYPLLCTFLSIWVVIFEIGFIGILFLPRFTWLFLAAGVAFHWGNYAFMNVGGWLHPWILVYVIYIPPPYFFLGKKK